MATGSYSIDVQKQQSAVSMPAKHYHDSYEIYYLLDGERFYFIKDEIHHVARGDLVLIDRYDIHKTSEVKGKGAVERILIVFKPAFLADFLASTSEIDVFHCFRAGAPVVHLNDEGQAFVTHLLQRMLEEYRGRRDGYETSIRILLAALLAYVKRSPVRAEVPPGTHRDPLSRKMLDIARHLNARYADRVTLPLLAARFSISKYYLCRSFRKVTGIGIVDYLNNMRVRKAQALLRETKHAIGRVAEEVGFTTTTHFERVFKTLNGVSPLRYRKGRTWLREDR